MLIDATVVAENALAGGDLVEAPHGLTFGRYRAIAEIGRGGMGIVYLCLSTGPGGFTKLFAVKQLKPSLCADPDVVARFLREARIAGRLNHPNIVQTLESATDGTRHYLVMEHLDGQPLHAIAKRIAKSGRRMPLGLAAAVLCGALEGLDYLHRARDVEGALLGVIHRDVSPQNVIVTYDGQVKLLDFGIAKAVGAARDTATGIIKGKLPYMAPERVTGGAAAPAADTFSVGVMLWEMVTGRRLWEGRANDFEIWQSLARGEVPVESNAALSDLPDGLRRVLTKAVNPDKSARYETAASMATELRAVVAALGQPAFEARRTGREVAHLFASERERMRVAVDERIRAAVRADDSGSLRGLATASSSPPSPRSMRAAAVTQTEEQSRLARGPITRTRIAVPRPKYVERPTVAPRRGSGGRAFLVATAAALVLAPIGVGRIVPAALARWARARTPVGHPLVPGLRAGGHPAPELPPSGRDVPAPTSSDAPPEGVVVHVHLQPSRARAALDGRRIEGDAYVAVLPKGTVHTIHASAAGYRPYDATFTAAGDVDLVVTLQRAGGPRR